MRNTGLGVAVTLLMLVLVASPAHAAAEAAVPGSFTAGYGLPQIVVGRNTVEIEFVNADIAPHDIVSDGNKPGTLIPLFKTPVVDVGGLPVMTTGVKVLGAGSYPFHCSIHPGTMKAVLLVR